MVRLRSVLGGVACAYALAVALVSCRDDPPGAGPGTSDGGGGVEAAAFDAHAPSDGGAPGDADALAPACDPTSKFSVPVKIDIMNTPSQEDSGGLSEGDLVATWVSNHSSAGARYDVMFAKRPSPTAPFGTPAAVPELFGESTTGITVSADGRIAVLQRSEPTTRLWITRRQTTTEPWGVPEPWSESVDGDSRAHLVADGSALYLTRDWKLHRAPRVAGGTYGAAVELAWVTPPGQAISPTVTADELTIYFGAQPPGPVTEPFDIYVARRSSTTDPWGTPELVAELKTDGPEWPTWTSPDGCVLWFVSGGSFGDAGSPGGFDHWMARRAP